MLPFQTFSAAVWPALLLVVLTPIVDAARARSILKNAKTIRRIVHVNRHNTSSNSSLSKIWSSSNSSFMKMRMNSSSNSSGPIPAFEWEEDQVMMARFRGLSNVGAKRCHPRCIWHCTDPVCDKTCSPVCEPPKCETRCPKKIQTHLCGQTCNEPDCVVMCKKEKWENLCSSQDCPNPCEITCKEPECKQTCEAPVCHDVCEDPHCEWTCKEPENCPKPDCQMQCEQPTGCLVGIVAGEVPKRSREFGESHPGLPEDVDTVVKTQAVAKLEGVDPLEDAKPLKK